MAESLIPSAPKGVGGICPICDGQLDGMTWCMTPGNEEHGERCTNCCTLIYLDSKGKPIGDHTSQKEEYLRKERIREHRESLAILKMKQSKRGFFNRLFRGVV